MHTVRRNREKERRRASWTDPLTGLWNRRWLDAYAPRAVGRADGRCLAVMLFDADSLSRVNDRSGYRAGDACLVAVSRALARAFGADADIVRVGGDEFLVPYRVEEPRTAARIARAALAAVAAEPELRRRCLSASAGIAFTRAADAPGWGTLIDRAYHALRRAKRAGGQCVRSTWV